MAIPAMHPSGKCNKLQANFSGSINICAYNQQFKLVAKFTINKALSACFQHSANFWSFF